MKSGYWHARGVCLHLGELLEFNGVLQSYKTLRNGASQDRREAKDLLVSDTDLYGKQRKREHLLVKIE